MFTKEYINKQLKYATLPQKVPIIVHSSLRAVGKIEGGADALIDVLKENICKNGGLLCIPTHTWANADKKDVITLDLIKGDTCIGTLPSVAAKRKDCIRSLHPTHSMAVFGDEEKAKEFVSDEPDAQTPTPPFSCYGKVLEMGGYVLLIGVKQNKNTFLHCVEEILDVKNRLSPEKIPLTIRHTDGKIETRYNHVHFAKGIPDVSANFPNYEKAFRYYGGIRDFKIGNADVQLCSTKIMASVMTLINKRTNGKEILNSLWDFPDEYYK